jgi:hypothetical protein
MKRLLLLSVLLASSFAAAQFTTVTGTVVDPNSLPYAGGTISATLVTSASPTLNGFAYTPPTQPTGLNQAGFFTMRLADNTVLLPAATQWSFTVCSAIGTVNPAIGKGSVCFVAGPITISGASQDISATLNAAALALTLLVGGGGTTINPTNNVIPKRLNATTFADSCFTDTGTAATCTENLVDSITTTGTSGTQNGITGALTVNPSGASSQTTRNLITLGIQAGNTQNISGRNIGLNFGVSDSGSGNLTSQPCGLCSIQLTTDNLGTANITDQAGVRASSFNDATAAETVTTNSGVVATSGGGAGAAAVTTTDANFRAEAPSLTANLTMTHHYAFYAAGAHSTNPGGVNPDGWAFFGNLTDKSQLGVLSTGTPLTVSTAGNGNGAICLSGNTSGCSSFTASPVAGTAANPVTATNTIALPTGTATNPSVGWSGGTGYGFNFTDANDIGVRVGGQENYVFNAGTLETRQPICDYATATGCLTFAAALISASGTGHPNIGFATDKGQHLVSQAAQADSWGVATCAGSTVTVTFTRAYTSTPVIVVSDETAAGGARVSAKSNTAFTITCSGATDVVDYFTGGNPN